MLRVASLASCIPGLLLISVGSISALSIVSLTPSETLRQGPSSGTLQVSLILVAVVSDSTSHDTSTATAQSLISV